MAVTKQTESFFELVYEVVRLIPKGRVTSYGAIARYLGSAQSSRMVGWAMNSSGDQHPPVPAHRVLNRIGMLSGKLHFGPGKEMQRMLEKEKIKVEDDQVVDFEKLFWDPEKELHFDTHSRRTGRSVTGNAGSKKRAGR